jgi:S-(hydroxymethyl)glutathione dehydrogenase/alcohol dehydrogenase
VQGAALSNAGKIIAVDVHPEKLAMAKKFGATHLVQNKHDVKAVIDKIQEITWGVGTDYSMEFVGFDQTHETYRIAYGATRKNGTMLFVGVPQVSQKTIPIEPRDFSLWRKHLVGVLFGDAQFQSDIPRYIQMYEKKQINLDDMVTKECRLEDINACFQNILAGNRVARQVIRFN